MMMKPSDYLWLAGLLMIMTAIRRPLLYIDKDDLKTHRMIFFGGLLLIGMAVAWPTIMAQ